MARLTKTPAAVVAPAPAPEQKRRGRPPGSKNAPKAPVQAAPVVEAAPAAEPKRRGRPRKNAAAVVAAVASVATVAAPVVATTVARRRAPAAPAITAVYDLSDQAIVVRAGETTVLTITIQDASYRTLVQALCTAIGVPVHVQA